MPDDEVTINYEGLRIACLENTHTGEVHRVVYIDDVRFSDERCNLDDTVELKATTKDDVSISRRCGNCWG